MLSIATTSLLIAIGRLQLCHGQLTTKTITTTTTTTTESTTTTTTTTITTQSTTTEAPHPRVKVGSHA